MSANEMDKVIDWLTTTKLSFNTSRTKFMLITNKYITTDSFKINNNELKEYGFTKGCVAQH